MGKSVQVIITSVLLAILLTIQSIFVLAIVLIEKTDKVSSDAIEVTTFDDGSFRQLQYVSSATGATSGIRYRFTEINLNIGGMNFTLDTRNIAGAKPPAGKTEYYNITITRDNVIEGVKKQLGRDLTASEMQKLEQGFANPNNIDIGATVEIYNASTGKILDRLRSIEDIYTRGASYGFPKRNLDDMASRFKGEGSNYMPPTNNDPPPKSGLRPSIIVN